MQTTYVLPPDDLYFDPEKQVDYSTWTDMGLVCNGVTWDWRDWLPKGFLTMLVGVQESCKSALLLRIAGCYILGWDWPDGTPYTGELGSVVWAEAEAAQGLHLDRARKFGLPLDKLITPFTDPMQDICLDDQTHLNALANVASIPDVRFIAVDSLGGGTSHNWKDSTMIKPIKAYAEILRDVGKPGILSHHLRKMTVFDNGSEVTLERVSGNTSITQVARVVWGMDMPNQAIPEQKRLSVVKSNFGLKAKSIGVGWEDNKLVFGQAPKTPQKETKLGEAKDLLLDLLRAGPKPQREIEEAILANGLSHSTITRAKQDLCIVSKQEGKVWYWGLPVPA